MGYIYEDYKKDIDGFQNDYDYLQSQVDAALSAELAGDTATARDISESLFEQSAADNTKIITPDEYAAWIRDAKKASTEGKYDADWQAARADEHFVDKTSLKETRDQSFSEPDAEDLEDLEKAIQNNQDILGDAILERQQAMAAAGIPIENPTATEGDKLAQDLANRMRWSEQCYLVNHIGELSDAHRLYQRDYSYIDLIDGSPAEFMNRLYHRPYSGDIVSITPDDASELTPLFRLSKVLYEWKEPEENSDVSSYSTKHLTEVPIIFEKMARQDLYDFDVGKTQIEAAGLKDPDGNPISQHAGVTVDPTQVPATGYSWEKFEWSYIGSNPETVRNDITAKLTLTFQDFNQLSKVRIYSPDPTEEEENPDPIAWSLLDLLGYGPTSYRRMENRADEYHEKFFEIKVVCGWNTNKFRGDKSKAKLAKAIDNQRVIMYLTLVDHDFDINDLGTFTLNLSYRARLESVLTEPKADILSNDSYREALAEVNTEIEKAKKDCDWEGLDTARDKYFEEIEKFRRVNLKSIIETLVSCGEGPIHNLGADRQPHNDLPFTSGATLGGNKREQIQGRIYVAQPSVADLANFATGVWDRDTTSATTGIKDLDAASSNVNLNKYFQEISANNSFSATDPLKSLQGISPGKDVISTSRGNVTNLPFFFLGDLLEVAAHMALNAEYFKQGELTSLTPDEANRIKIILGPYEFFDGSQNRLINLADVPISVRAFTDFWYKNVVSSRREQYLLLHFVRDVIEHLVIKAIGAECFAYNGHPLGGKPVRLRTAFLTLPPKEGSIGGNYPDPLLNLSEEAYANSDSEGYGTIKLKELNKLPEGAFASEYVSSAINTLKDPKLEEAQKVHDLSHYLIVYTESAEPWDLNGDEEADYEKGIFHLQIHKGILHQARFKKTDQPYLREARYEKTGYNPLVHLSNVYNVDLSMLGNTVFYPGSYVFINPVGFGTSLGSPTNHEGPSLSNVMGLGGYHFIIDVTNTIGKTFTTSMGVRWDNNGAGRPRTMELPTRNNENPDCPPVPKIGGN